MRAPEKIFCSVCGSRAKLIAEYVSGKALGRPATAKGQEFYSWECPTDPNHITDGGDWISNPTEQAAYDEWMSWIGQIPAKVEDVYFSKELGSFCDDSGNFLFLAPARIVPDLPKWIKEQMEQFYAQDREIEYPVPCSVCGETYYHTRPTNRSWICTKCSLNIPRDKRICGICSNKVTDHFIMDGIPLCRYCSRQL
jgi:ribosomal protein L37AE/L43A